MQEELRDLVNPRGPQLEENLQIQGININA
jgi:hypothetical protein